MHGMANVRRRSPTAPYTVTAYLGRNKDGEPRYKTISGFSTKREAERAGIILEREIAAGMHPADKRDLGTVAALLDRWFAVKESGWSPVTRRNTEGAIRLHLKPGIGHIKVDRFRVSDADAFYLSLEPDLAPASIRRLNDMLASAFKQAVIWGDIATYPLGGVSLPKADRKEMRLPTPEQVGQIVAACESEDVRLALMIAASTGVRRGQLVALRWRNIDFATRRVTYWRNIVDGGGKLTEKEPKSGQEGRATLPRFAARGLGARRLRAAESALAVGLSVSDDCFVFSHEADSLTPWRPDYLSHRFDRARKEVGLGWVRLHDLRHYCASQALSAGVDVVTVSSMLGHAKTSTTLNIYSHCLPGRSDQVADMFDEMFGQ